MSQKNNFILSPEDIILDTEYTFSINPNDDYQYWNSPERIQQSEKWCEYTINNINAICNLKMEISRLGRLHFHGTIKWVGSYASVLAFFKDDIRNILTKVTIEIDVIKSMSEWNEYIHKGDKFGLPQIQTTDAKNKRLKELYTQKQLKIPIKHKDITNY